jgi:NAD(P) transhydrogenase
MHHEREVVEMERRRILKNLELHRIELVRSQAAFEDAHTLSVTAPSGAARRLRAEAILISTGSNPHRLPEIAFDDVHVFDSDTFLQMDRIPQSLAVIGGGVIGCEYASIFMALGVKALSSTAVTASSRSSMPKFPSASATASPISACSSGSTNA